MASAVYPQLRESIVDWILNGGMPVGLVFKCVMVNANYTYDPSHEVFTDIPANAIVGGPFTLANVTFVDGIIDADDIDLTGLNTAEFLSALIVYLENPAPVSKLCAYIDNTADGTIPANIDSELGRIRWSDSGIFRV